MDYSEPEVLAPEIVRADPVERLLEPARPRRTLERTRLAIFFALFLACHIGLLAIFILQDEPYVPQAEEIAVEIVPPPEAAEPPPPPPQQPPEPEKPQPKQQAQTPPPDLDLTPAQDAPRPANDETVDRVAPDKQTAAPQKAPPAEKGTPGEEPQKAADARSVLSPDVGPVTEKFAPDKPDAETIERAEAKPEELRRFTSPEQKEQSGSSMPTIAQMMARLEPIPDYKIAGAAKPSPVSGGTAKPNYLSTLHGLILPRFQRPPVRKTVGKIIIYIDTIGHVLHMGVLQPSGSPDLDNAAMAAVRRAAPFPTPPPGLPPVVWTYE